MLINHRFDKTYSYYVMLHVLPFTFGYLCFLLWNFYTVFYVQDPTKSDSFYVQAENFFYAVLYTIAIYQLIYSIAMIYYYKWEIFDTNKLLFVKPVSSAMVIALLAWYEPANPNFWVYMSYTNIILLVSALQVYRHIQMFTEPITIIFQVITKGLPAYLVVFFLLIFGFGAVIKNIAHVESDITFETPFDAFKASYFMALGDFGNGETEVSTASTVGVHILFILASLVCMIIFSNILISAVSEEFNVFRARKEALMFQNKCDVIITIDSLFQFLQQFNRIQRGISYIVSVITYYTSWKMLNLNVHPRIVKEIERFSQDSKVLMIAYEEKSTDAEKEEMTTSELLDQLREQHELLKTRIGLNDKEFADDEELTLIQKIE